MHQVWYETCSSAFHFFFNHFIEVRLTYKKLAISNVNSAFLEKWRGTVVWEQHAEWQGCRLLYLLYGRLTKLFVPHTFYKRMPSSPTFSSWPWLTDWCLLQAFSLIHQVASRYRLLKHSTPQTQPQTWNGVMYT